MSDKPTLVYFAAGGAGEAIRLIFAHAEIEINDERLPLQEWPQHKAHTPFGVLPLLKYNGKTFGQSKAIARFAATMAKLAGCNELENLEIDYMVDTIADLIAKFIVVRREPDEIKRAELSKKLNEVEVPFILSRLNSCAEQNGGYLAVGRLTWADLYLLSVMQPFQSAHDKNDYLKEYPHLDALRAKVVAIPSIAKYLESRPKNQY